MLDDLRRNYVLNRQQGLVIRPYRKSHVTRETDKELLFLSEYLCLIGEPRGASVTSATAAGSRYLAKHGSGYGGAAEGSNGN